MTGKHAKVNFLISNYSFRDVLARNQVVLKSTVSASRLEYSAVRTANAVIVKTMMVLLIGEFYLTVQLLLLELVELEV